MNSVITFSGSSRNARTVDHEMTSLKILPVRAVLCFFAVLTFAFGIVSPSAEGKTAYAVSELREVETPDDAKIRELRDQEIVQLRIALGRRLANNRRADLYFRLAEIYVEAYRSAFLMEGRVHEKRLEKGVSDKFIDRSYSKPFLRSGIKACNDILTLKIPYSKLDQVYYFLGFSYAELENRRQSTAYFDTLTRKFPNSVFAPEAYRELGDAAFADSKFRKAQAYYEVAVKKSSSGMVPRIMHKLAWCHYRTKQYSRAVASMKEAISLATKNGEKFLSLREEALRDMALFMTEAGQTNEAIAYFQSVADKTFYPKILEKLGKQYERNVEPAKATQVYESLLKTNPESEATFRVLVKLVDLDLRQGRYREALGRLNQGRLYESGDTDTQVAAQNLRAMIRRTATEHHEKFRKKSGRADLEVAEAYYQAYLKSFLSKDDPRREIPEIQMYLAEVKRDLGKSKEASELYRQVVESSDKRYAKEAGALWTASLAEAIKKSHGAQNAATKKAGRPSELEKEFVEAADRLEEALAGTNEARDAALKAAQVHAGYKNTQKDAIKRIKRIIARSEKTPQSLTAARLWVQILSDRVPPVNAPPAAQEAASGAIEDLADVTQELRKNAVLMAADQEIGGGKLKALLSEHETRLKLGTIAREEQDQNFAVAAKGYEAMAADSTQREFAEKAYENALASYVKAVEWESVDRVIVTWLKRFPKSSRAADAVRLTATRFLIDGRFEHSARLFEKLGRDGNDADSLETAARLYEGSGEIAKAQQCWSGYLELYPKAANRWKIALALAMSYDSARRDSEASKSYQYCMTGPVEFEAVCGARLGDLYARNRDFEQAKQSFRKVSTQGDKHKSEGLSPFVAYARFRLAEMLERNAKFQPLRLPEAQLKNAMTQRLEFLEPLSRAYVSAMDAGGPWGVAALGRLATWVMKFADELERIPAPADANPEALASFRKNVEAISAPLRKKAVATWNDAYVKALSAELLSPAVPEIVDRLADVRVPNLSRAQGFRGRFRLAGMSPDGGKDGSTTALQNVRERLLKNPQEPASWIDYGNLLWGEGKPLLAKITYDRALGLKAKYPAALNNRAVVDLGGEGQEDWLRAAEAQQLLQTALKEDSFFLAAKINRALLLNYYRLYAKARPLWDQIVVKENSSDVQDGIAIALQGSGDLPGAEAAFKKAADLGASDSRFAGRYHEAARVSVMGSEKAGDCLDRLEDLDAGLFGFEKTSAEYLKGICTLWKSGK